MSPPLCVGPCNLGDHQGARISGYLDEENAMKILIKGSFKLFRVSSVLLVLLSMEVESKNFLVKRVFKIGMVV